MKLNDLRRSETRINKGHQSWLDDVSSVRVGWLSPHSLPYQTAMKDVGDRYNLGGRVKQFHAKKPTVEREILVFNEVLATAIFLDFDGIEFPDGPIEMRVLGKERGDWIVRDHTYPSADTAFPNTVEGRARLLLYAGMIKEFVLAEAEEEKNFRFSAEKETGKNSGNTSGERSKEKGSSKKTPSRSSS